MLSNCCVGKTFESPLDCKEIKPVNPKGNQSWIFFGRTDAKAETPVLWPPDVKSWLIGKIPDAGKDWRQEEKGMTEDEIVGWHHWLDVPQFEQALGVRDGQGSLACCSPWGCKDSDTMIAWTEFTFLIIIATSAKPVWVRPYLKFFCMFLFHLILTTILSPFYIQGIGGTERSNTQDYQANIWTSYKSTVFVKKVLDNRLGLY